MAPLKVTITFRSPLIQHNDNPIHLDALLAWCLSNEAEECDDDNPWDADNQLVSVLEKAYAPNGDWVWKASRLVFTPLSGVAFINQTRRTDATEYLDAKDKGVLLMGPETLRTDRGNQKSYQFLVGYQWMAKAEAWCVGDADAVIDLMSRLRGVGKMVRNGYGLIQNFTIDLREEAADKWRLRALPIEMDGVDGVTYYPVQQCLRPPYWRKECQIITREPLV